MGNNIVGSTRISYTTKDEVPIQYIYYDLKGKNRFPSQPSERQIQLMFQRCLKEIKTKPEELQIIREFNPKYKFRFVILHGRKLEEHREKYELNRLRTTQNLDQTEQDKLEQKRKRELDEKLVLLQKNQTAIKMHLGDIDRFIFQKKAWTEFIRIKGIERLLKILDKAIKTNKQGTKTVFQNQIEILKFLKELSDRNQTQYFEEVSKIKEYTLILLRAYHPVNIAVSAYVLTMLKDYSWKVEDGVSIVSALKTHQSQSGAKSFLSPFLDTIYQTTNILMCYYNLNFINELFISIVDDEDKQEFQKEMHNQQYQYLIEFVKNKLQENQFKIENCTFQAVSQQIYKHATNNKQISRDKIQQMMQNRMTGSEALQTQQLLLNFVLGDKINDGDSDNLEDQDSQLQVYIADNDKKTFNGYVVETLNQINHYYKYTIIIDKLEDGEDYGEMSKEIQKLKKNAHSCEEYVKRMRGICDRNGCEEIMYNCLKTMQYFDKYKWKKLQKFVMTEIHQTKDNGSSNVQSYKQQLDEKDKELKALKKEFYHLKTQMVNASFQEKSKIHNNVNVSKLDMSLFQLDAHDNKNVPKKVTIPENLLKPVNINNLPNLLPPPQMNIGGNILPPPPGLNTNILPPPPSLNNNILPPPPQFNTNILPPPPGLNQNILPPPPGLDTNILPPPPSLNTQILPPPPSLNHNILPPPPGLTTNILPPPPSLNNQILPPPPGLDTNILPPPPSFNSNILPPPPSLDINILPPPPMFNIGGLPPPPTFGLPPIGSLPSLPGMPSLPGLPGLPGLPSLDGGLFGGVQQKLKEKRKPKVTLKNCNYKTLTHQEIEKTIWSQVDDSKIKLDQNELQSLFSRAAPKEMNKVQSSIMLSTQPKKKEAVKLLGSDRWRNMQIVLTKLKLPQGAMIEALTTCSGKYAVPTILESVKSILPTQEEEMNISSYDGSVQDLGKPQKLLKELISIPQYANRIKSILFNGLRQQLYFDLQKNIQDLTLAFISLKSNYRLHYVLQVALAVGNYLNGTGLKGGAWGFKLDTLQRLEQVKSQDSKMNAGFYIIKQVWKKYHFPIFEKEEVDMYQFVSKMPISQIKVDLAELKRYVSSIDKAFHSKQKNNPNDRIDQHCQEILIQAKSKCEQLQSLVKKMEEAYTECATFYCQDPTKGPSDEIGKKIFKSILFIFNSEKAFYQLQERRKKQQSRKAVKNEIKFSQPKKQSVNPESALKKQVSTIKMPQSAIFNPLKPTITEVSAQDRLKQLQKAQQQREKKFLQQMMKKRNSKMVAFRQSKNPGMNPLKRGQQPEIDFLKGL